MAFFSLLHTWIVFSLREVVQINLKLTWRHGRSATNLWIIQKFRRVSFWAACHIDVCPFTTTILFTYLLKVIPWYRLRFAGVASLINFLLIWVKDQVVTPIMVVLWRDDLCWVGALSWLFQCWMIIRNLRNHAFHTEMSDNFQKQKHAAYFIYVFQSTKKHTKGS